MIARGFFFVKIFAQILAQFKKKSILTNIVQTGRRAAEPASLYQSSECGTEKFLKILVKALAYVVFFSYLCK